MRRKELFDVELSAPLLLNKISREIKITNQVIKIPIQSKSALPPIYQISHCN